MCDSRALYFSQVFGLFNKSIQLLLLRAGSGADGGSLHRLSSLRSSLLGENPASRSIRSDDASGLIGGSE